MMGLDFVHRERVYLLGAAAALVLLLIALERRSDARLERFAANPMLERLLRRPSRARRGARFALVFASLALSVLALMRPQSRSAGETLESRRAAAEVMIALDVSRSMLAEDAQPNRLERAKAELRDLIRLLAGHNVGLMAFAGRASVLCPLTPDHSFLRLVLDSAGPRSVSRGGTRIGDAIRKAVEGMTPGQGAKLIVLVTDGGDQKSYALEAAKKAREEGVRIVAIGFGDEKGSEIPITDPKTGERAPVRDRSGSIVRSRLDGSLLREIALATEGAYVPAGVGVLDLEPIVKTHLEPLLRASGGTATRVVHPERYQGFVLGALVALLLAAALCWTPT